MKFVAKTLYGLEKILGREIAELGGRDIEEVNRAVLFSGDLKLLYKVNYCSRTALSVLMPISEFRIRSKEDLFRGGSKIEWDRYLTEEDTFSIVPVVNSPLFDHTGYPGLVLKDAIADYFRKKTGKRPSVNNENPSILINLHISAASVTISIDSSVVPLFKRGYRQTQTTAPLNEVLAAGILLLSGWDSKTLFLDPMCGSGTFPIEAALFACKIPPGKFRSFFGFERWKGFDANLYQEIKDESEKNIRQSPVKIFGSDISEEAVNSARQNISKAGLSDLIDLTVKDFRDLKAFDIAGSIFLNPPYGQRLLPGETDKLYSETGTTLKHSFPGYTAWLITSNKESLKNIGLKHKEKYTLFNGALECTLVKFELYQGSKKVIKD
jgi:putative N6-adenine-specific DNA methylase